MHSLHVSVRFNFIDLSIFFTGMSGGYNIRLCKNEAYIPDASIKHEPDERIWCKCAFVRNFTCHRKNGRKWSNIIRYISSLINLQKNDLLTSMIALKFIYKNIFFFWFCSTFTHCADDSAWVSA